VGTWAARTYWRTAQERDSNEHAVSRIGSMILSAVTLAVLLVTSSVEELCMY
jgi:hypothetical protein